MLFAYGVPPVMASAAFLVIVPGLNTVPTLRLVPAMLTGVPSALKRSRRWKSPVSRSGWNTSRKELSGRFARVDSWLKKKKIRLFDAFERRGTGTQPPMLPPSCL